MIEIGEISQFKTKVYQRSEVFISARALFISAQTAFISVQTNLSALGSFYQRSNEFISAQAAFISAQTNLSALRQLLSALKHFLIQYYRNTKIRTNSFSMNRSDFLF
ncbi:hypothetical protein [Alkalibacillus silvisoli]|uniref:hypothetical protein n=1 Tax=Alkalibacillus silvisoli TaxID=392823 RepID=UPI0031E237AD